MSFKRMRRYKFLSKPIKRELMDKPDWIFTYEMKRYQASERLKNLAKPMIRDTSILYQELPIKIPQTALKYKGLNCLIMIA